MVNAMIKKFIVSFMLFGLLAMLTSCAMLRLQLNQPRVTLADIQIAEMKTLETVFQIQLRFPSTHRPIHCRRVLFSIRLRLPM